MHALIPHNDDIPLQDSPTNEEEITKSYLAHQARPSKDRKAAQERRDANLCWNATDATQKRGEISGLLSVRCFIGLGTYQNIA